MKNAKIRWALIPVIIITAAVLSYIGQSRLSIETDITSSLPRHDPVITDARYVLNHLPVKDRVIIDVACPKKDLPLLLAAGEQVESGLKESGLFGSIGLNEYQSLFPDLMQHIMQNLPLLFTKAELEEKIAPLLTGERIASTLAESFGQLQGLEGIGQAEMIASDPLGFKNIVLAKLAHMAPTANVQIIQGKLVSADGTHLLVMAEPVSSGTDTAFARRISQQIEKIKAGLKKKHGSDIVLTPVGSYRAALDNEDTAKADTQKAVVIATIGIAILLLLGFPRPLVGLLALVPAVLGTIAAAFVYSLFSRSLSVLAIGFGSTIISFTVDYGIAYLLFLDRPHETDGLDATRESWSLGLLAMLTTAISFAFLFVSDFRALAQIGYFAALGVAFTYIFVHTLFPAVFVRMPEAKRKNVLPLQRLVNGIMASHPAWKPWAAAAFCLVMAFFARPVFKVDLAAMNTVSASTRSAEELVSKTWGNVFSKIYLMSEAGSAEELRAGADRLADRLEGELSSGALSSCFVPSMIFPGRDRAARNLAAWNDFWTKDRVSALTKNLDLASRSTGYASGAFSPFLRTLQKKNIAPAAIPERFHSFLGMQKLREGGWALFSIATPGGKYNGEKFRSAIASPGLARLFDPGLFADRLGGVILSGFMKMAALVGIISLAVVFLYLLDLRLTAIAMASTLFALVCTLGTLKLLGEQPGIPTIIVTVIIIGMGTDYALYLVRAYQRYGDESHPGLALIRLTVFLSAASTLIGFGVLSLAGHALLRSAGLSLLLGIGYSFAGTVLIVPPLMARLLKKGSVTRASAPEPHSREHVARVRARYRLLEPYPRIFAALKLRIDPLFQDLPAFLASPKNLLDVGTGYAVPAAWIAELYPDVRIHGLEPDRGRSRIAERVLGDSGTVTRTAAPSLPDLETPADTALALDMIHYLDDGKLSLLLEGIRQRLAPGGRLIIRATVPRSTDATVLRLIERTWCRLHGLSVHYRTREELAAMIEKAGYAVSVFPSSKASREEQWFVADRPVPGPEKKRRAAAKGKKRKKS